MSIKLKLALVSTLFSSTACIASAQTASASHDYPPVPTAHVSSFADAMHSVDTWLELSATLADGITTVHNEPHFVEINPLAIPLTGRRPSYARELTLNVSEVVAVTTLVHLKPKAKPLQRILTVVHATMAVRNASL